MTYFQTSTEFIYLRNLLCSDFYCMLFLTAVIQRRAIHMLVMKQGQFLHLLPNPCDFILDLKMKTKGLRTTCQVDGFWIRRVQTECFCGLDQSLLFYLIHPLYPFGGKFLGDSDSGFGIQTDPRHQGHSIIGQLQNTKKVDQQLFGKKCFNLLELCWRCINTQIKSLFSQYLIKLLLRLADSRVAPSNKKRAEGEEAAV